MGGDKRTGTNYRIVGAANCTYFARAERIALLLKGLLNLSEADVSVQMKHPDEWSSFFANECKRLQFEEYEKKVSERGAKAGRVLVYSQMTGRLVGGSKAFSREVAKRYGIKCDLNNAQLTLIAKENRLLHTNATKTAAYQSDLQKRKKLQLGIMGGPGTLVDTHAAKIAKLFGLSLISPDQLVVKQVKGEPNSAITEKIKHMIRSSGTVADDIYAQLIKREVEKEANDGGWVLMNYPRTPAQAQLLDDNDIDLQLLLVLTASSETLFARRRESVSEEKMNVYVRKWIAMVDNIVNEAEIQTVTIDASPSIAAVAATCKAAVEELNAQVCLLPDWVQALPADVETPPIGATADAVAAKLRAEKRAKEKAASEEAAAAAAAEKFANEVVEDKPRTEEDKAQLQEKVGSFWDTINPETKESLPLGKVKTALLKANEEDTPQAKEWATFLDERLRNQPADTLISKDLLLDSMEYMTALSAEAVEVASWQNFDRKQFKKFFELRDVDVNGTLGMKELTVMMLQLQYDASTARDMMKWTDKDGSDSLDFPELCAGFKAIFLIDEVFDRADFKAEFDKVDTEGEGAIPSAKLCDLLVVYGYSAAMDMAPLLAIADKDGTGTITFDALCAAYCKVFEIATEA